MNFLDLREHPRRTLFALYIAPKFVLCLVKQSHIRQHIGALRYEVSLPLCFYLFVLVPFFPAKLGV